MNFKTASLVVASLLAPIATEARAGVPERSLVATGAASASPLTFAQGNR